MTNLFTNKGFYPTNIFIFATEYMQFHCVYNFGDKKGHIWVEHRISKSKNDNRFEVMFCHAEIHIPVLCPVNFLVVIRINFPVGDHCL